MIVGVYLDGPIEPGEFLSYDAHTHLTVSTTNAGVHLEDNSEADTEPQVFTHLDNPF